MIISVMKALHKKSVKLSTTCMATLLQPSVRRFDKKNDAMSRHNLSNCKMVVNAALPRSFSILREILGRSRSDY